jgi:hypothetical protein
MVYQNIDLEGGSALAAADLLTASGGLEIAGLDRPGEATGNLFVDVEVMAEAPAATGFDPILVIADDSQTEIDIAAIV